MRLVDRPHRPRARPPRRPAGAAADRPSSSASAARSPAATSTSPGSTSTTRSGILLWALDNEKVSGVVNATAPNPVTNRELLEGAGPGARPARRDAGPRASSSTSMYGSEFGAVLRGGQRVMPRRALDLGYEFKHPDLDEALATCSRQGRCPSPERSCGLLRVRRGHRPSAADRRGVRSELSRIASRQAAPSRLRRSCSAIQGDLGGFEDRAGEAGGRGPGASR